MRKLLQVSILILVLYACEHKKVKTEIKATTNNNTPLKVSSDNTSLGDTIKSFDDKVYQVYLSKAVMGYLKKELPDWKLPEPSRWQNFWFKEYKDDSVLVNYISNDFNCDSQSDYAFILQNQKNKQYAVWILQSKQDKLSVLKLHDFGKAELPLQFGIELVPKGSLSYIDFENDNPKPINLKCPGIQVSYFESGAETYYWNVNKFESVTTGD